MFHHPKNNMYCYYMSLFNSFYPCSLTETLHGCDFAKGKQERLEWLHVRHKNSITCHTAGRVSYRISKQLCEPTL